MNPNSMSLPIAEHFHSLQGEGVWAGTPMHFIRTAGCSVGQHPEHGEVEYELGTDRNFPILKTGRTAYRCHTFDGRGFWCDTDFQKGEWMTLQSLIDNTWEDHICLTGGEPMLHSPIFPELSRLAIDHRITVHIETSGTIEDFIPPGWWVTCSPKANWLPSQVNRASEIKLLIDENFALDKVPLEWLSRKNVFIQPVNAELHIDLNNLKLCLDILRQMPHWRLSVQLHKCFGWR